MYVEKLVSFSKALDEVYYHLQYAMAEDGFSISQEDGQHAEQRSFLGTSLSQNTRVDVKGFCFRNSNQTIVQLSYSPAYTPSLSRPVTLNADQERAMIADLESRFVDSLNNTGEWMTIEHGALQVIPDGLIHPDKLSEMSHRSTAGVRLLFWLGVVLFGLGISYFSYVSGISFGSIEGWSAVIVFALFLFFLDLYRYVHGKK